MTATNGNTARKPQIGDPDAASPDTYMQGDAATMFRDAMARLAASVCVVTTNGKAGREGVTVSSFTSVSIDGADHIVSVSLFAESVATAAILENESFCVSLLSSDQEALANAFAGRTQTERDARFEAGTWHTLSTGSPALHEAAAVFDCSVFDTKLVGRHQLIFGRVERAGLDPARQPLMYHERSYAWLQRQVP